MGCALKGLHCIDLAHERRSSVSPLGRAPERRLQAPGDLRDPCRQPPSGAGGFARSLPPAAFRRRGPARSVPLQPLHRLRFHHSNSKLCTNFQAVTTTGGGFGTVPLASRCVEGAATRRTAALERYAARAACRVRPSVRKWVESEPCPEPHPCCPRGRDPRYDEGRTPIRHSRVRPSSFSAARSRRLRLACLLDKTYDRWHCEASPPSLRSGSGLGVKGRRPLPGG